MTHITSTSTIIFTGSIRDNLPAVSEWLIMRAAQQPHTATMWLHIYWNMPRNILKHTQSPVV